MVQITQEWKNIFFRSVVRVEKKKTKLFLSSRQLIDAWQRRDNRSISIWNLFFIYSISIAFTLATYKNTCFVFNSNEIRFFVDFSSKLSKQSVNWKCAIFRTHFSFESSWKFTEELSLFSFRFVLFSASLQWQIWWNISSEWMYVNARSIKRGEIVAVEQQNQKYSHQCGTERYFIFGDSRFSGVQNVTRRKKIKCPKPPRSRHDSQFVFCSCSHQRRPVNRGIQNMCQINKKNCANQNFHVVRLLAANYLWERKRRQRVKLVATHLYLYLVATNSRTMCQKMSSTSLGNRIKIINLLPLAIDISSK